MEALMVLFQFFPIGYVILQWFGGDPLPNATNWSGVGLRFLMTVVMLVLFVCIQKACKLAADIFQAEIDAIEEEKMKPIDTMNSSARCI
jgi:hypothetical protein